MGVRRIIPNITTTRPDESRAFYRDFLGLAEVMDLGWITTLAASAHPAAQLSLVGRDETAPVQSRLSIEVDDVDAMHAEAVRRGVPIVYPLTDEPWGVRRFFVVDPNGVVVNILRHHR